QSRLRFLLPQLVDETTGGGESVVPPRQKHQQGRQRPPCATSGAALRRRSLRSRRRRDRAPPPQPQIPVPTCADIRMRSPFGVGDQALQEGLPIDPVRGAVLDALRQQLPVQAVHGDRGQQRCHLFTLRHPIPCRQPPVLAQERGERRA